VQSVVARVGGDEFAILLGSIQHENDASTVATRILERLGEPFHLEGRRMFITASIGIALNCPNCSPEDLLRNADTAMYHAKTTARHALNFLTRVCEFRL